MALDAARRWNAHFVLKGYHSIVASPDGQTFIVRLATLIGEGGTGDVLTGISRRSWRSWRGRGARVLSLGVYLHGLAAEWHPAARSVGLLAAKLQTLCPRRLKLLEELRSSV